MQSKFIEAEASNGTFAGTRENRHLSQREKLEVAILNLATALGEKNVERAQAQSGVIYRVLPGHFQSASNTIVTLSQRLASKD